MSDDNLKTWPERIWLQHGDEDGIPDFDVAYLNGYGITWCKDSVEPHNVEYVRADRITELERQNAELLGKLYQVLALAEKWHKNAVDTGFAMSEPGYELEEVLGSITAAPQQQSEKEGAGTVDIDREGARFWHRNCTNHLGGVMKVARDEPDKSLITCLHCGKSGYYPVGGVGRICAKEEATDANGAALQSDEKGA